MAKGKKKQYKKKRTSFLSKFKFPSSGANSKSTAVPNEMYTVMKYSDIVAVNPGAGGLPANQIYCANSIFDADVTNVGHQPRGHDQLLYLYTMYEVQYATIKVTPVNSDNNTAQVLNLSLRNGTSVGSSLIDALESSNSKWMAVGARNADGATRSIRATCKPATYLGTTLKEPEICAPFGANPANRAFWHITGFPVDYSDSGPIDCVVEIRYYCRLFEPARLTVS